MKLRYLLLGLFLVIGPSSSGAQQAQVTELRIATVAPDGSPWLRVFRAWDSELRQRTNGTLTLRMYPGGSQGQETDYIDKMQSGQLDGAALSATGLAQIVRPVLVMGLAGLVDDYPQLDRVRRRMKRRFNQLFEQQGYVQLGWGDIGKTRLFSRRRVARPSDLRQTRPWAPRSDVIFTAFLDVVGANPRRLGIPEVYPALQTGMIDTVPGSALAAVALQWHTRVQYYTERSAGIVIGATVLKKSRFDRLSPEHQQALRETSQQGHRLATRSMRRADDQALVALSRRLTAVDVTPYEQEWLDAGLRTRERLVGRVFPEALLDAVARAAAP